MDLCSRSDLVNVEISWEEEPDSAPTYTTNVSTERNAIVSSERPKKTRGSGHDSTS